MCVFLIRRWRAVCLGAVLAGTVAVLVTLFRPQAYVASVNLVTKRARIEVNYDTRIRTISPESSVGNGGQGAPLASISPERRQALGQLVLSPDIEQAVRTELGAKLPPNLQVPGRLSRHVRGQLTPRSEIITITVEAPTKELAEMISSSWARAYEHHINALYASTSSAASAVTEELTKARQTYDRAEAALTRFVGSSPLNETLRVMERREELLRELLVARQGMLGDLNVLVRRVDSLVSQAEALGGQLDANGENPGAVANTQLTLTLLKAQAFASSMSTHPPVSSLSVMSGSESSGVAGSGSANSASSQTASAGVGATSIGREAVLGRRSQEWTLPTGLQIQGPAISASVTASQQRADVQATVQALRDWRDRLRAAIAERSADLQGDKLTVGLGESDPSSISQLEAVIRGLQRIVAEEGAVQRNLKLERDVAWETFTSLVKKVEEARVAGAVGAGNEVSVANRTVNADPKPRGLLVTACLGLLGGALVTSCGLLVSPFTNWLRGAVVDRWAQTPGTVAPAPGA